MKSLRIIKGYLEQSIAYNEDELFQIYDLIDNVEKSQQAITESSLYKNDEYKDEQSQDRLAYYASYLYAKSEEVDRRIREFEKENKYIIVENGRYTLNSEYSYEELYAFITKYKDNFSYDDLMDIFVTVKQIKIKQVIEEVKEEITPQIEEIPIEVSTTVTDEALELAKELEEEEEKTEELSTKDKIIYFFKVANKEDVQQDENILEEAYNLIQNTYKKCKSFQDAAIYSFVKTHAETLTQYRESEDIDSIKKWISQSLPDYKDRCTLEFFDRIEKSIKICDNFLRDYMDLISLSSYSDIDEYCPFFTGSLNNIDLMKNLDFEYAMPKYVDKKETETTKGRKNIVFYTPKALKSAGDYFDDMQTFVSSLSTNDWGAIYKSFTPNSVTSISSNSYKDFSQSEYLSIAAEFELRDITRALGSRDTISEENKQRLMDHYGATEMEVFSVHNIFTGPHNGADGGRNQSIGQYGYTPYYKQIRFYRILNKKEAWTDAEFEYICRVVDCCDEITKCIINGDKRKLGKLSEDLRQALDSSILPKEKKGSK